MLANGLEKPVDALAAATPYLRLCGIVVGGWMLAKSAAAAKAMLEAGEGDAAFLEEKLVTARFYVEQLLPQARALLPAVTARGDVLYDATF